MMKVFKADKVWLINNKNSVDPITLRSDSITTESDW